jgi:hypothetical protein
MTVTTTTRGQEMSSAFAITTAANSVRLDNSRRGQASFTVSNTSERELVSRAQVEPQDGASPAWFTITGEPKRNFAVGGTEQFVVQIAVPVDVPAGSYSFRLNALGVDNPDEDYTQGQSVTFEVPAVQPEKKTFPWWIILVGVGVLVVGGVIFAVLSGRNVEEDAEAQASATATAAAVATANAGGAPAPPVVQLVPLATLSQAFLLSASDSEESINIRLFQPGPITVRATFNNTEDIVVTIRNRVGTPFRPTVSRGGSPREVTRQVSPSDFVISQEWTVGLELSDGLGIASGNVVITFPTRQINQPRPGQPGR